MRTAAERGYVHQMHHVTRFAHCARRPDSSILLVSLIGAAPMRSLLTLAALVFALWAIDLYAFNGRYWAAAGEEMHYYVRILNDRVQGLTNRLRP
jgi:hypothetical protein